MKDLLFKPGQLLIYTRKSNKMSAKTDKYIVVNHDEKTPEIVEVYEIESQRQRPIYLYHQEKDPEFLSILAERKTYSSVNTKNGVKLEEEYTLD